ncbi:Crp/Fnr family transcriptional regulator [Flavihumibacter rivuli]|uniref:Crp/Fnr family transcriptional regulator n=1 Tax=Flavihumibacter rivuli TaxID=2838156 RepID=UPI001BDE853A|nr:Crp/Fnr family transcriptional regulator [Flavihumibacter rivuli]ULQ56524.1 Crp/Fnr family transcriptional regulator [Flavihumibacter rivuli]
MSAELLLQSIQNHISLSETDVLALGKSFRARKLRKKHFILQEGEVLNHAIFVTQGCLRSYSVDKNGFEHILQFAPPGWWISDMKSFKRQEPATLYIDAIEDSEILMISKADLDQLYLAIPKLEHFFRVLAENALITFQHRLIDNLSLPAKDRYANFCSTYPTLIQLLPQKYVASYIGVTPEFLSKMLHQSARKS